MIMNLRKINISNIIVVIVIIFFIFYVSISLFIGNSVKTNCIKAKKEYYGDCVTALIKLLNDETKDFKSRNSAIWTLGQLGDQRALFFLEKFYSGNIPSRESLGKSISQYELRKAINLIDEDFNISAIIWRNKIIGNFPQ